MFNKIVLEDLKVDQKIALQLAGKAMNDTRGPDGLVTAYLVFGCIPRFPAVDLTVPNQKDRMNELEKARNEMATIVAELRLKTALASRVPRNADLSAAAGDLMRVFRETYKRYVGPLPIIRVDGTSIFPVRKPRSAVQYSSSSPGS